MIDEIIEDDLLSQGISKRLQSICEDMQRLNMNHTIIFEDNYEDRVLISTFSKSDHDDIDIKGITLDIASKLSLSIKDILGSKDISSLKKLTILLKTIIKLRNEDKDDE